jgi:hypothetical protein
MKAEEFRKIWQIQNPKIVHIPSVHETQLMEAFAKYQCEAQRTNVARALGFRKNTEDYLRVMNAPEPNFD